MARPSFRPGGMSDEDSDDEEWVDSSSIKDKSKSVVMKVDSGPVPDHSGSCKDDGWSSGGGGGASADADLEWGQDAEEQRSKVVVQQGCSKNASKEDAQSMYLTSYKTHGIQIPCVDRSEGSGLSYKLKLAWNARENKDVSMYCQMGFRKCENAYCLGLLLMTQCHDFYAQTNSSRTLALTILEELKAFLDTVGNKTNVELTADVQKLAFNLSVNQKRSNISRKIMEIYRIDEIKPYVVNMIKEICQTGLYKEACVAATNVGLLDFDVHEFMIPLFLQNRINLVETYLEFSEQGQHKLLTFLDGVLSEASISNFWKAYMYQHKISNEGVDLDKVTGKTLLKFIYRLSEKFKIEDSEIPNAYKRKALGEIRHLFFRRYNDSVKCDITEQNFHELLDSLVETSAEMQEEAVYLFRINDSAAGANFALRHKISQNKLPSDILSLLPRGINSETINQTIPVVVTEDSWEIDTHTADPTPTVEMSRNDENVCEKSWDTQQIENETVKPKDVYALPLSSEREIKILTNADEVKHFSEFITEKLKKEDKVISGFDAEWKPVGAKYQFASLLQIAFQEIIFLVDIVTIKQLHESRSLLNIILSSYFANDRVIKLGYDVKNDLKMLSAIDESWVDIKSVLTGFVDLQSIKGEIIKRNPSFFLKTPGTGLSDLLESCLLKTLSKAEQFSDWEKRPLREAQILYAATDAFCLLDVYIFLKNREKEVPVRVNEIITAHLKGREEEVRKNRSPLELVSLISFPKTTSDSNDTFVAERNVKFICDSTMQGLGRHLRSCGFDTVILENNSAVEFCCHIAKADNRYILTKGKSNYYIYQSEFPAGRSFYVTSVFPIDQLEEIVRLLKVAIDEAQSFTFCLQCNSNTFIDVPKKVIARLLEVQGIRDNRRLSKNTIEELTLRVPVEMISCAGLPKKRWTLLPESALIMQEQPVQNCNSSTSSTKTYCCAYTKNGVLVELRKIPIILMDLIENFFVCNSCGKCYWSSRKLEESVCTKMKQTLQIIS